MVALALARFFANLILLASFLGFGIIVLVLLVQQVKGITIVTLWQIGTRAHTLIAVNYFSVGCVVVTTPALALGPDLDLAQPLMRFALHATWRQAGIPVLIRVCGFVTQFLMTSGVAVASSSSSSSLSSDWTSFTLQAQAATAGKDSSRIM
ncbi:hypothetical protein PG994_013497, partial [Apiospora phragmitis]